MEEQAIDLPEAELITREAGRWRVGEIGDVEFRGYVGEILATVRAMETERCARVCEAMERQQENDNGAANTGGAEACASAIRSGLPSSPAT